MDKPHKSRRNIIIAAVAVVVLLIIIIIVIVVVERSRKTNVPTPPTPNGPTPNGPTPNGPTPNGPPSPYPVPPIPPIPPIPGPTPPSPDASYILDLVGSQNTSCPSGYALVPGINGSNANLKQNTGDATPNIYLCKKTGPGSLGETVTDLSTYYFRGSGEKACPSTSARLTYDNQFDFLHGCSGSTYLKLCKYNDNQGPRGAAGPLQDIVISGDGTCPGGYNVTSIQTDGDKFFHGKNLGDLNLGCKGSTLKLCVK